MPSSATYFKENEPPFYIVKRVLVVASFSDWRLDLQELQPDPHEFAQSDEL